MNDLKRGGRERGWRRRERRDFLSPAAGCGSISLGEGGRPRGRRKARVRARASKTGAPLSIHHTQVAKNPDDKRITSILSKKAATALFPPPPLLFCRSRRRRRDDLHVVRAKYRRTLTSLRRVRSEVVTMPGVKMFIDLFLLP